MVAFRRGNGSTVDVICTDDRHNRRRTARIASFEEQRDHLGKRVDIAFVRHLATKSEAASEKTVVGGTAVDSIRPHVMVTLLLGSGTDTQVVSTNPDEGTRWHYELKCPLCGRNVRVRRDALVPVLEALMDAGLSTVTLEGLGRRVG